MRKQKKSSALIYNFNFFFKIIIFLFALNYNSILLGKTKEFDKVILPKNTFEKISTYFLAAKIHDNAFYSKSVSRKLFYYNIMYVAISQSGDTVIMSFCNEDFSGCAQKYLAKFQTKKKCERLSNQKCRIIIEEGNFLTINSKKIKILNVNNHFVSNNKLYKLINYEIQYPTNSDFSDGEYE